MMNQYASTTNAHGIAVLRISLGAMWVAHAGLKALVFTLPGTAKFFESVGFAGWLAYPVFAAELVGGTAIIAGLYSRQVSLLLTPVLAGAIWTHLPNGWVFTGAGGGWEYPVFLLMATIAHWLMDDGSFNYKSSTKLTLSAVSR